MEREGEGVGHRAPQLLQEPSLSRPRRGRLTDRLSPRPIDAGGRRGHGVEWTTTRRRGEEPSINVLLTPPPPAVLRLPPPRGVLVSAKIYFFVFVFAIKDISLVSVVTVLIPRT